VFGLRCASLSGGCGAEASCPVRLVVQKTLEANRREHITLFVNQVPLFSDLKELVSMPVADSALCIS
jgi:hypothetical protein